MVIMEIFILTGYVADNVNELKSQSETVKKVDSSESKIVLYLDEVRILHLKHSNHLNVHENFVKYQHIL